MKKALDLKCIQFLAIAIQVVGSAAYAQTEPNPALATVTPSALVVKTNDSILFLGDSVTFWGNVQAGGFGQLAIRVLKAFGTNDSQLITAEDYWLNIPEYSACSVVSTGIGVTMRQYQAMYDLAARENCTIDECIRMQLIKVLPSSASPVTVATEVVAHSETKANAVGTIEKFSAVALVVKNNDSIAFLGDAITLEGNRTASGLKGNGPTITPYAAGVRDDSSRRMLDRLVSNALSHRPTFMVLSPGIYDVRAGLPLDQFKVNITAIVDQAQKAGVKVMILTTQMMSDERAESDNNVRLAPFDAFLRQLATERKSVLADVNSAMRDVIQPGRDGKPQLHGQIFCNDGDIVPFGHQLVATCVLKALGANANQLKTARDFWLALSDTDACIVTAYEARRCGLSEGRSLRFTSSA